MGLLLFYLLAETFFLCFVAAAHNPVISESGTLVAGSSSASSFCRHCRLQLSSVPIGRIERIVYGGRMESFHLRCLFSLILQDFADGSLTRVVVERSDYLQVVVKRAIGRAMDYLVMEQYKEDTGEGESLLEMVFLIFKKMEICHIEACLSKANTEVIMISDAIALVLAIKNPALKSVLANIINIGQKQLHYYNISSEEFFESLVNEYRRYQDDAPVKLLRRLCFITPTLYRYQISSLPRHFPDGICPSTLYCALNLGVSHLSDTIRYSILSPFITSMKTNQTAFWEVDEITEIARQMIVDREHTLLRSIYHEIVSHKVPFDCYHLSLLRSQMVFMYSEDIALCRGLLTAVTRLSSLPADILKFDLSIDLRVFEEYHLNNETRFDNCGLSSGSSVISSRYRNSPEIIKMEKQYMEWLQDFYSKYTGDDEMTVISE